MAESGVALLTDPALHARMAAAGRQIITEKFCANLIVPRYEAFYTELIGEVRARIRHAVLNENFEDAKGCSRRR